MKMKGPLPFSATDRDLLRQLQAAAMTPTGQPAFSLAYPNGRYSEVVVGTTAGYAAPAASILLPVGGGRLPSVGRHLRVVWKARSDFVGAATQLNLRLNGDGGPNYIDGYNARQGNAAPTGVALAGQTVITVGRLPGTTAPVNYAAQGEFTIPNYLDTVFYKGLYAQMEAQTAAGAAGEELVAWSGNWSSLAPVTSLTLSTAGGNILVGSIFSLYIDP